MSTGKPSNYRIERRSIRQSLGARMSGSGAHAER